MTTIQYLVFEERPNEHLTYPTSTSALQRSLYVSDLFTPNLLWQDLYHHQRTAGNLTQTLIDSMPYVGKKSHQFFFCFVVIFFSHGSHELNYKYSCTAKKGSERGN